MSISTDAGHFFQTTSSLDESRRRATKRTNTAGSPIPLSSKILALAPDPYAPDTAVYVCEAAGCVRRVSLEPPCVSHVFRPDAAPDAPLTCLALLPGPRSGGTLFAGSWDKNIYAWPLPAAAAGSTDDTPGASSEAKVKAVKRTARLVGHTDFVKALLVAPLPAPLLISASADATIAVWDPVTGARLHGLVGHARGVQALALEDVGTTGAGESYATIFSADSTREIRRWFVSASRAFELSTDPGTDVESAAAPDEPLAPLVTHETSVYALRVDGDGDLWTASADKSARCLVRERGWKADTILKHPDFVRDVIVDERRGLVVTACRDEGVRVWDRGTGKCVAELEGHWEEVTGLALVGKGVVSVGIDGTVRWWPLDRTELERLARRPEEEEGGKSKVVLTAEEEAELAELLDDSD
ncbi:WD40 repeat-like protein [Trichodelitschia bisporula]|uniref:WD40 repeat-like protein n=1 Tax=Trichodelitschia bisporula TaxID=703511 RepID=A0A6G1HMI4_9PEZI|nr:WD40 repeat-like protein [Trichodelitschia bisporula]